MKQQTRRWVSAALLCFVMGSLGSLGQARSTDTNNGVFEHTFTSQKSYADPFNEVDVDVIFAKGGESWRVPTFWRGGNQWTVRFAPPTSGEFTYHLESTDKTNSALNGHEARVTLTPYSGNNPLRQHGMLRVA
ncbi:MAG: hypothetical protein QOJ51_5402, partial [Acidobacteriaceae bacterium]|nr:hypothetical protein [Acidobacteriaceae bacterium]